MCFSNPFFILVDTEMNVGNLWKCVWHRSGMSSNLLAISVGDDVLKWIFIVNSASAI